MNQENKPNEPLDEEKTFHHCVTEKLAENHPSIVDIPLARKALLGARYGSIPTTPKSFEVVVTRKILEDQTQYKVIYHIESEYVVDDFLKEVAKFDYDTEVKRALHRDLERKLIEDASNLIKNRYHQSGKLFGFPIYIHNDLPKNMIFMHPRTLTSLMRDPYSRHLIRIE